MVGDGANDILAINMADVGIGINHCKSSYGSSYSVPDEGSVLRVVTEGKATVANLMDQSRYTVIVNILSATLTL